MRAVYLYACFVILCVRPCVCACLSVLMYMFRCGCGSMRGWWMYICVFCVPVEYTNGPLDNSMQHFAHHRY